MSVLVVDDDQRLRELLDEYLTRHGFQVYAVPDGAAGLAALADRTPGLVILDLMMPGLDGLETCRRIRGRSAVPIIMLTAKGEDTDRIVGLELGADDYLAKPFNPRELLARMRAVLRRSQSDEVHATEAETLGVGDLWIDLGARRVTRAGREVELTSTEFDLLRVLVQSAGRVVPRDGLMERARGTDFAAFDRSIDVHISHIRRKLGDDPRRPRILKTIRGVGYMVTKP